jgi:hypothetical protein
MRYINKTNQCWAILFWNNYKFVYLFIRYIVGKLKSYKTWRKKEKQTRKNEKN